LKITPFVRYAAINNKKTQQCGMPSLLFLRFENQQKIVVGIKNFMLDSIFLLSVISGGGEND
ncbi:hypothetical protein KJ830_08775, partial [bacterium]|nr:hypothetical protein [bacterium]